MRRTVQDRVLEPGVVIAPGCEQRRPDHRPFSLESPAAGWEGISLYLYFSPLR